MIDPYGSRQFLGGNVRTMVKETTRRLNRDTHKLSTLSNLLGPQRLTGTSTVYLLVK